MSTNHLEGSEQYTAKQLLTGRKIIGLNFTNSDMVGLELDSGRTIFVPNEDILQFLP